MPYIRQFFDTEESCISYFVCCPNKMKVAIIDPSVDWKRYVAMADAEFCDITHVVDTHIHSDHRSGARELARETGAKLCMSGSAKVNFEFSPLNEGDKIGVGNASFTVLDTPGHTTESISLVYRDSLRSDLPWAIFTGDSLLVGDVGRRDIVGAGTYEQMYDTLFRKLLSFEDYMEVYPAHYAGSECGSGARMSFKSVSTIGFERRMNPILQAKSLEEFVKLVEERPRPMPPWFADTRRFNMGEEQLLKQKAGDAPGVASGG